MTNARFKFKYDYNFGRIISMTKLENDSFDLRIVTSTIWYKGDSPKILTVNIKLIEVKGTQKIIDYFRLPSADFNQINDKSRLPLVIYSIDTEVINDECMQFTIVLDNFGKLKLQCKQIIESLVEE